ncbi:MAG: AlpA family phage regulatory protein [Albidovulum sp.]|nr:AlpA family phage regulatory protein [Albidovulum sp.]MDE0533764.1 AlpA family phage regulatory protein [Albidovulum sp.]
MEEKDPPGDAPFERLLRIAEVMRLTGLSKSTIHRKWRSGEFPAPLKLFRDGRAFGWKQSEILDWMRSRERAE